EGELDLPASLADHPRYRIVDLLGKGGMGDVYQAEHIVMNRPVALKIINRELVKKSQAVERFRREVHAAARLSHPNIVTAHDAEQAGELHFLVMEFVDGIDLSRLVKERGALPVHEACDYARQAALGLQHAHEQGMVHRDIKPHNLMVTADGTVKILDFGLAGFATESALMEAEESEGAGSDSIPLHLTTVGSVMGTPDYIAPEQACDAHSADIRADVYSLGCTLYFLLTGQPPHNATTVIEKLQAHAEHEPPAIESIRVDVPDELAEVIRRMMAKDPKDRFQTPQELADALDRVSTQLRSSSGTHPPQDFTTGRPADVPKHRQNIKSLADLLLGTAFLNMVWIAIVVSNAYFNLGGFTVSPFWETLGAPLFYSSLVGLPLSLMLGFGARRMRRFQSYRWSMAAAILAMIPVTPVNVVLGLVCGLWAMVLLVRPEVKRLFVAGDQSHETGTPFVERSRSTTPDPVHSGAGRIPRWAVGVGFFGLACMLAGIFYIQIGTTTLKFEVLDPDIQVRFAGESVVFQDRNGADSTFTIKPGTKQEFVVEQSGAVVETDSLVLNRGDRVVLKIDVVEGEIRITPSKPKLNVDRTPHAGQDAIEEYVKQPDSVLPGSTRTTGLVPQSTIKPETKQAFHELIVAAREASTDEEWAQVLAKHAPTLALIEESETEQFGKAEMALMREGGRILIELLAGFPDTVHNDLLQSGYLKWSFKELDEPRREAMQAALTNVISASDKMGFPAGLKDQVPDMLASGDVGFVVAKTPKGETLLWYLLIPEGPIPMLFPLFGTPHESEADGVSLTRSVYKQIGELENKPYSDLPKAQPHVLRTVEPVRVIPFGKSISALTWMPDHTIVTSVYDDKNGKWKLFFTDPAENNDLHVVISLENSVSHMVSSLDGKWFAYGSRESHNVVLWDAKRHQSIATFDTGKMVHSVAFSPDSKLLAGASWDGSARVWSVDTHELVREIGGYGRVHRVLFSPDGKTLAVSETPSGQIDFWDTNTWTRNASCKHGYGVGQMAFSPDSKRLVTGGTGLKFSESDKHSIKVWNADSGQLMMRFDDMQNAVEAVAVTPDSRYLIAVGGNWGNDPKWGGKPKEAEPIRIWDLTTQQLVTEYHGHDKWVRGIVFSPDGSQFATAGDEGTVKIWELNDVVATTHRGD
ncbi:MAG TPA: protein kinase, partial [Planctomycetaceae bacterium]|nr:protein kinase [Planctomycetaceae bacterium]